MSEPNSFLQPFLEGYGGSSNCDSLLQSTLLQNNNSSFPGISGVQNQNPGLNNYGGSQCYLIHDNTAPTFKYGPSSNIGTDSLLLGVNDGFQKVPPSYDSYTETSGYNQSSVTQFVGSTNNGPLSNNMFPTIAPQIPAITRSVGNSPPGNFWIKANSVGTSSMAKKTAQRKQVPKGHGQKDKDDFSEKLISYARYNRNITLIKEVFSDTIIPKTFVSTERLETLQEQVRLLEKHYKTVQLDLATVEDKCLERKREFMESTTAFKTKYDALCRPPVGVKNYSKMFLKHYNQLKATEASRRNWEETLAWARRTVALDSTSANISSPPIDEFEAVATQSEYSGSNANENEPL